MQISAEPIAVSVRRYELRLAADAMPVDCSLLLSTSPPSANLPPQRSLADDDELDDLIGHLSSSPYACRRVASFPVVHRHQPLPPASSLKTRSLSESAGLYRRNDAITFSDLKRELSALISADKRHGAVRRGSHGDSSDSSRESSPDRPKKRVAFADDRGMQLVTVRVMTEPSDVPPRISSAVFRSLLGAQAVADDARPRSSWIVDFAQPASEYMAFRETLERQCVALENVVVRNDQCKMVGTIKVKNVAFEKRVFVRFTDNAWQSYFDRPAKFQTSCPGGTQDTFAFDVDLPLDDDRRETIAFCVGFVAAGAEHWDSNGGDNFRLVSNARKNRMLLGAGKVLPVDAPPPSDAFSIDCDNWTNFASWKNVSTEGPYW